MLGKVSKTKFLGLLLVLTALAVVMACGSEDPTARPTAAPTAMPTAMMEPTATEAMMMEPTATEAMMMEPTATEAMMMPTATEAMMMEPTPTEAMMMEPTPTEAMMMPTDSMMMMEKAEIIFHNGNWGSNYINNAVAMYILETGYGYPVKEVVTNTNTMKVTLPEGDVHVSMELWRVNLPDWYDEFVVGEGTVVDLAGTTDPSVRLDEGAKGQIISVGGQGTYVPTYVIEGDAERGIEASAPDLSSVADLANYVDVFADPSSPGKGRIFNCPDGWACSKVNASNWSAQGLADDFNFVGPGDGTALKAAIASAYIDGEPFIAYYWQPTDIVNTRNLTLLEEPAWTQECQDAINAAVEETPYVSEIGCGYPVGDVHTAVHSSLTERAPDAVELLANVFLGDSVLGDLELWKAENDDAEWIDVAIKYLKENRDVWTTWITGDHAADIIAMVDAELAREG